MRPFFSASPTRQTRFLIGLCLIVFSYVAYTSSTTQAQQVATSPNVGALVVASAPIAPQSEAVASSEATQRRGINFLSLLTQGGWFMFPLLLLSVGVVTIGIERYLALRREKVFPPELIDQLSLLSQSDGGLDPRRAYQACQRYPSSAAYVLRSMLVKVGRPQLEIENSINDASQREATRLAQMTSWLSLAAAIAPLIGLLGTVWGITQAFYDTTQLAELNAGQNRGVALANGIYIALVTTMVGLMIAIPAAILSHFYENRIVQLLNEIEEMASNLLPQFERYEGQVRFTQGVGDVPDEFDSGEQAEPSPGESSQTTEQPNGSNGSGKRVPR